MRRLHTNRWLALAALIAGCFGTEQKTTLVPADPFGNTPPVIPGQRAAYAPAPLETAARVDRIGRQVIAANSQIGMRPQFRVIGAPQAEVLHNGTADVLVTEGLVKLCATDGQIAALLCHELAKMVAEREAAADPKVRLPERSAPMEVRIGNDNVGGGAADQLHRAELARFEKERRPQADKPLPLPDCSTLSRDLLKRAGFAEADYDAAEPYLKNAAENMTFARQLKAPPTSATPRSWTR